jgi:hypothetical protein
LPPALQTPDFRAAEPVGFHFFRFCVLVSVPRFLFRALAGRSLRQQGSWRRTRPLLAAFCRSLWLKSSKQQAAFTHVGCSFFIRENEFTM